MADEELLGRPGRGVNQIEFNGKSCTHEVAWPEGQGGSYAPPEEYTGPPARVYPFEIDPFQRTAVNCLEAGHSVLVAAHTSAGKTVVAEYAFGMALRDKQRVIYTSPLKALSNQKYRELQQEFGDVGLMTGDITINPDASCLVMTTEILRSMLYRGSDIVREVQLLVYDEIHYLRDKERGVVWEESIILAPRSARFVFLSATIPNAREFAEWIAKIHQSPCHVVYTEYRPTPLEHYVFPAGGESVYLAVDSRGTFREDNFSKAVAILNDATPDSGSGKGKSVARAGAKEQSSDVYKVVKMIMDRNYDPVIVFSFSKKECESLAMQMASLDLNSEDEKKMVSSIFHSAVDVLSEEDRKLPQIDDILPMLMRGFGVHHSGLLPLIKELVEILFQEGLLKVLFATETFSTGLNMPAKTVVFTHVRKFDGGGFRWVSGGEYIQMSGRAGRRGLDDKGIVIMIMDAKMEPDVAKGMLKGSSDILYSEFHLGYNMLINLLRAEGVEPEELMRRSYRQFQNERRLPIMQRKLKAIEDERSSIHVEDESSVEAYESMLRLKTTFEHQIRTIVTRPKNALPFLQAGRLVRLTPPGGKPLWAVIVNFQRAAMDGADEDDGPALKRRKSSAYRIDVLANAQETKRNIPLTISSLIPVKEPGKAAIVPITLGDIEVFSSVRLYLVKDLRTADAQRAVRGMLEEVEKRFKGQPPLLHPVHDMKIADPELKKLTTRLETAEHEIKTHSLHGAEDVAERLDAIRRKHELRESAKAVKKEIKSAQSLILHDELKQRRKVLRQLGFVDNGGVVALKGRVASEISSGDELVLAELIFEGFFKGLTAPKLCAILSCFVWNGKAKSGNKVPPALENEYSLVRATARRVGKAAIDQGVTLELDEYADSFSPELMSAVSAWAEGAKFSEILKLSEVFEGSVVRAIRRVEELLQQLIVAMRSVGDLELAEHFETASKAIRRDIIFAASLYL